MNHFIMADSQQCLGCHAHEVACVMARNSERHVLNQRYFQPRIVVIKHQRQHSAVAYHRHKDASCARSCPNGAISHDNDSVQVNPQERIGCKSCVVACPFGTMQIVLTPAVKGRMKATAHKCDLRQGREQGPTCVENRPAQALQLVTENSLTGSSRMRRLRTAGLESQSWHASTTDFVPRTTTKREQVQTTPARGGPDKLVIEARGISFGEIYLPFRTAQAKRETFRYLKYGDRSTYRWTCPLHSYIPQWIELVKAGNIDAVVELSHRVNYLPEVTGCVYPQNRFCEGTRTVCSEHGAVTIGNIEHYTLNRALSKGWWPDLSHVQKVGKRVAIIGAGPTGLACMDVLTHNDVNATVYDHHPKIGGLLTLGILAFKLGKSLLTCCRKIFSAVDIHFELSYEVSKGVALKKLLEDYDAVFVGVGTYRSMGADLPNEDAPGVYDALPFPIANTRQVMGLEELPEEPFIDTVGLNAVVLGGGDMAMDCVQTALRHGINQVICAYRCGEANILGLKKEMKNAREEGANFEFSVQPVELVLRAGEQVSGVCSLRTQLGEPDVQDHHCPVPIAGSEFVVPAGAMIMALGFYPYSMSWPESHGVKTDSWGCIAADVENAYRYQTSSPKIFVGGDAIHGAGLVMTAMAGGRRATQGIVDWPGAESVKSR